VAGPDIDLPAQTKSQKPRIPTVAQVWLRLFEFLEKETPPGRQALAESNGLAALPRLETVDGPVRNAEFDFPGAGISG
jgi:hypothetical protein